MAGSSPVADGGPASDGGQPMDPAGLASRLGELAQALHTQDGVDPTLEAIVRAAVGTVPGADYAGVMRSATSSSASWPSNWCTGAGSTSRADLRSPVDR